MRLSLLGLLFFMTTSGYAEDVTINRLDTTAVPQSPSITYYPASLVERPLILPQKLVEIRGSSEYRQLSRNIRGLDLRGTARIGILEKLEASIETSLLPLNFLENKETFSNNGFSFGGLAVGSTYRILEERDSYPEVAGTVRLGFAGTGPISITYGSTFIVLPELKAKKIIDPKLSLEGNLILGFGNRGSGLYQLKSGGVFRPFEQIDVTGHASLEAIGFREIATLSLIPGVVYHLSDKIDLGGSFRIGVLGGEAIGNNFMIAVATRF